MNLKTIFKDALPIIVESAPTIAAAIGGPIALAAGYVIPVLAQSFGVKSKNVNDLVSSIMQDPNASDKLAACESTHAEWLTYLMQSVNNLSNAEINIKLNWH